MAATGHDSLFQEKPGRVGQSPVTGAHSLFSRKDNDETGTLDQRSWLARELHDGLLQSLTSASLQLEAISRLIETDPAAARMRLREVQELIVEEQRDLREWLERIRRPMAESMMLHAEVDSRLQKVCRRVARWGPRVDLVGLDGELIPTYLCDHILRLVEESLNNIVRHARARIARVEVHGLHDAVKIVIADD